MELHRQRIAAIALFATLLALLCVRAIAPAVSRVDTDFPNYLTAAKIVVDGGQTDRLYDDAWFQEQVRHYAPGNAEYGKFVPFPPPTALLLVPLAGLQPLAALRVMTAVSLLCLALAAVLLAKILAWRYIDAASFLLLSGYAVFNALKFGQPYILVSLSCILGYYAYLRHRPLLAGLCFGIFVPIKYLPVVFLLYFACRREWRVVIGGALAIAAVMLTSIVVLGPQVHATFLSSVLGQHLVGEISMQSPFTANFQSFDALSRRLFVFDSSENPQPWLALPWLQPIILAVTKIVIATLAVATLLRLSRNGASAVAPSMGLLGILTLLLAPATATYHFVLLWLPVGLLMQHFARARAPVCAAFLLCAYALIGFLPYGHTAVFEGRGVLSALAFPRLWLLCAMFAVSVRCLWTGTDLIPQHEARPLAAHRGTGP
jgi:hypothetical protein